MDRVSTVIHTMDTGNTVMRTTVIRTMLTAMIHTVTRTMVTLARLVVQTERSTTTGGDSSSETQAPTPLFLKSKVKRWM